jgi:Arc/MetJ-type ribon-helix-helix transcriptional regulator
MIYCHTGYIVILEVIQMTASKIAITIDDTLLRQLDGMVKIGVFPNRSRAIQEAVVEKLGRIEKTRLAQECAKLDPDDEQRMADEGFSMEMEEWPAY